LISRVSPHLDSIGLRRIVEGNSFQEQRRPVPEVVRFTQILQDCRFDGNGWLAVGKSLDEGVERARVAVLLEDVSAGTDERDELGGKRLALSLAQDCPDLRKQKRVSDLTDKRFYLTLRKDVHCETRDKSRPPSLVKTARIQ
jgi:hypothetical protein